MVSKQSSRSRLGGSICCEGLSVDAAAAAAAAAATPLSRQLRSRLSLPPVRIPIATGGSIPAIHPNLRRREWPTAPNSVARGCSRTCACQLHCLPACLSACLPAARLLCVRMMVCSAAHVMVRGGCFRIYEFPYESVRGSVTRQRRRRRWWCRSCSGSSTPNRMCFSCCACRSVGHRH